MQCMGDKVNVEEIHHTLIRGGEVVKLPAYSATSVAQDILVHYSHNYFIQ